MFFTLYRSPFAPENLVSRGGYNEMYREYVMRPGYFGAEYAIKHCLLKPSEHPPTHPEEGGIDKLFMWEHWLQGQINVFI